MVYNIYHIVYDLTNLAMKQQEAVVSAASPESAYELLKQHLIRSYDLYPRKDKNLRETDQEALGFKARLTESLDALIDFEGVILPSRAHETRLKIAAAEASFQSPAINSQQ